MEYVIIWQGEEIDSAETRQEANYLVNEYAIAFNDSKFNFKIKKTKQ